MTGTEVINHDIEDKDVANYAEQKWSVSREDETEVVPTAKQKHLKQGPKNKQKSTFHRKKEGKREDTGEECTSSQSTLPDVPIQRSSRDLSQKQSEKILSSTNSREQYPKNENQEVKSSLSDQTQASLQNVAGNPSSRSRNRRRRNKQSKMERNLKDSDNKCAQGISSSERLAVGFNPTPKEGHLGDDGNEKDCKLYEPKLILVTGMRDTTSQDALSNYMELMASDDVEKVTFLGKGRAVVDLRNDPGIVAQIEIFAYIFSNTMWKENIFFDQRISFSSHLNLSSLISTLVI